MRIRVRSHRPCGQSLPPHGLLAFLQGGAGTKVGEMLEQLLRLLMEHAFQGGFDIALVVKGEVHKVLHHVRIRLLSDSDRLLSLHCVDRERS